MGGGCSGQLCTYVRLQTPANGRPGRLSSAQPAEKSGVMTGGRASRLKAARDTGSLLHLRGVA